MAAFNNIRLFVTILIVVQSAFFVADGWTAFVDTAGWMACADSAEPDNVRLCAARDAALKAGQTLITTDFIADETLTLIRFRLGAEAAHTWWQQVDGSSRLRWERVDAERFEKAHNLFFQYRDKTFRSPTAPAS